MLSGIDHIVIVVADLAAATRAYSELGFTVIAGGRHPLGSENALIAFGDGAYVELIAFTAPGAAHPWRAMLEKGGGVIDFCAETGDLAGELERMRAAGAAISGPAPLSRVRPDGFRLSWRLAIPQAPWQGVIPFLIEDETPREERVPRQTSHRNGAAGIATLTIAVADLGRACGFYRELLGQAGEPLERRDLNARGQSFRIGPHRCTLITPCSADGPIAKWLALRGSSPWSASFKAAGRAAARELDPSRTSNARLSLVPDE